MRPLASFELADLQTDLIVLVEDFNQFSTVKFFKISFLTNFGSLSSNLERKKILVPGLAQKPQWEIGWTKPKMGFLQIKFSGFLTDNQYPN
jgi:hypothetical protein